MNKTSSAFKVGMSQYKFDAPSSPYRGDQHGGKHLYGRR